MTKICGKCNQEKALKEYDWKKGKLRSICKSCVSIYTKKHYLDNKKYYIAKAKINRKRSHERLRNYLLAYYRSHSCVDCGESDPIVLEFDHVKGKTRGISVMLTSAVSIATLEREIAKCEVVCANCHRRRTTKTFNWYRAIAVHD